MDVVFVGQTPPPYGGQAIMLALTLQGRYEAVSLHHVRMSFSATMEEVGRFRPSKLLHLAGTILRIFSARLRHRAQVLYYPPAGPHRVPVYRDLVILLTTRWMFKAVIFHFHPAGLSEIYPHLSRPLRFLFRKAYDRPTLGIRVAHGTPDDPAFLRAERAMVVHNGVPDIRLPQDRPVTGKPRILFVGLLTETKGLMILLQACEQLRKEGKDFDLEIVGEFVDESFEQKARAFAAASAVRDEVRWSGMLVDEQKVLAYSRADIFCFPTFVDSETLPLVVLEAMRSSLPVVASLWSGIPEMIEEGHNGYLVPPRDSSALAERLRRLLDDEQLRRSMGQTGRQIFESRFTADAHHAAMQVAFDTVKEIVGPNR